jgi:hypothetical protein
MFFSKCLIRVKRQIPLSGSLTIFFGRVNTMKSRRFRKTSGQRLARRRLSRPGSSGVCILLCRCRRNKHSKALASVRGQESNPHAPTVNGLQFSPRALYVISPNETNQYLPDGQTGNVMLRRASSEHRRSVILGPTTSDELTTHTTAND